MYMKETMQRKSLQFNMNDKQERIAFERLEKIRYYQSKFIVRLINDFFSSHNLTDETSYDKLRTIVKLYVDGDDVSDIKVSASNSSIPGAISGNDLLSAITLLLGAGANLSTNVVTNALNQAPVNSGQDTSQVRQQSNNVNEESLSREESVKKVSQNTIFDDDDDEDNENFNTLQMAMGFKSMLEE